MGSEDKNYHQFPERLRSLLREKGDTITALARELGLSRQAVSLYADGTNIPNAERLCAIADYFHVSTDYLLGRTDVRSQDTIKQEVCNYLCLTENAVDVLKLKDEGGKLDGARHYFLDALLTAPGFEEFIDDAFNFGKYHSVLKDKDPDSEISIYGSSENGGFHMPVSVSGLLDALKINLLEKFAPVIDAAFNSWFENVSSYYGEGSEFIG